MRLECPERVSKHLLLWLSNTMTSESIPPVTNNEGDILQISRQVIPGSVAECVGWLP